MAFSLKKQPIKKSNVKTGSGSAKKVAKKRSWKKVGFFSAVVVLLISTLSYASYSYWQASSLKAKASGWTPLRYGPPHPTIYACKTYVNAYGGLWKIKVLIDRGSSNPGGVSSTQGIVYRGTSTIASTPIYSQWWAGTLQSYEFLTSAIYNDRFEIQVWGNYWNAASYFGPGWPGQYASAVTASC